MDGIAKSDGAFLDLEEPIVKDRYEKLSSFYGPSLPNTAGHPVSRFSRHLKQVRIWSADYIGDNFTVDVLPSSIEMLQITHGQFTDLGLQPLFSCVNLWKLHLTHAIHITSAAFQYLPRHLEDLCLDGTKSIFDSDFIHLPRSLKYISLSSAVELTNACISHLPLHAIVLRVRKNNKITPDCFQLLPASSTVRIQTAAWNKKKMT
jgi:hypothetical protein